MLLCVSNHELPIIVLKTASGTEVRNNTSA